MRSSSEIRFVLEFEVSDVEVFKATAEKCVEVSRDEPGTLIYDWYIDEETGRARLYEAYESVAAVEAHAAGPVFTDVGLPLMEVSKVVNMDAFGDTGDLAATVPWPVTAWGPPFVALET